jgi:hypothetical protein
MLALDYQQAHVGSANFSLMWVGSGEVTDVKDAPQVTFSWENIEY